MKYFFTMFLVLLMSITFYAQTKDTVNVPDTYASAGKEGTLNDAVTAAITAGKLSSTVFKLSPYGAYILTGSITTPAGSVLEIVAPNPGKTQKTALPMISWTASSAPSKSYNFDIGGEIRMKNVWLLYGSTDGTQSGTSLRMGDSASVAGGKCRFENVMFEYAPCPSGGSGSIEIYATHFNGKFINCYWKNCIDTHLRYYGRAVSYRYQSAGLHTDSLYFENCTFANMGYVVMQEGSEYADNVYFNHCTFLNIIMFSCESSWWYKMAMANCLFVNPYMFGYNTHDEKDNPGGYTFDVDSVKNFNFTPPFKDQDRRILFMNNAGYYETWLVDWMANNPFSIKLHQTRQDDLIPHPRPMLSKRSLMFFDTLDAQGKKLYPYMNKANLYENINPGLIIPATNVDSLKVYMQKKWDDNSNCNYAYNITDDLNQVWPLKENLAYTNTTLKAAGMNGYPLGDLYHWWPTEYASWKVQAAAERTQIFKWMNNGLTPNSVKEIPSNTIPDQYSLSQNYPNPFNPTTQIEYSIPKSGFVSLKVYNVLGKEIATLFAGQQNAGKYVATFDGKQLASGVYFYRLQADNVLLTHKLILMK